MRRSQEKKTGKMREIMENGKEIKKGMGRSQWKQERVGNNCEKM